MQLPLLDSDPIDLADLPRARLAERLSEWGFSPVHAARLWNELYRPDSSAARGRPELPPRLRARLDQCRWLRPLEVCREIHSADGLAVKYLLGLADDTRVETVLMRYRGRVTACLSTQAGCPVGCVFCATGQAGFTRNLSAGEIVAQALHVRRVIEDWPAAEPSGEPETLRNIVLMGMGEPLLNYDAVLDALDILRDPGCLAIGGKRITLSTVGVPAGIRRLAAERRSCSLAVSLHAATQAERVALVPAAQLAARGADSRLPALCRANGAEDFFRVDADPQTE